MLNAKDICIVPPFHVFHPANVWLNSEFIEFSNSTVLTYLITKSFFDLIDGSCIHYEKPSCDDAFVAATSRYPVRMILGPNNAIVHI